MAPTAKDLPRHGKRMATDPGLLRTRFARWLEAKLAEHDWSQLTLASRARVNQGYINQALRTGRLPADPAARKIAKALHTDPDDVLDLIYLDRVEHVLLTAPSTTRKRFRDALCG